VNGVEGSAFILSGLKKANGGGGFTGCGKLNLTQVLYQGTTSVVPQMQKNRHWALAPAGFSSNSGDHFEFFRSLFAPAKTQKPPIKI
jgi:hypothetical protein